jgi:hypothetical protein
VTIDRTKAIEGADQMRVRAMIGNNPRRHLPEAASWRCRRFGCSLDLARYWNSGCRYDCKRCGAGWTVDYADFMDEHAMTASPPDPRDAR